MIARVWRGSTPESDKDAYFHYLQKTGLADYRSIPGNKGVPVLRHVHGGRAEFTLINPMTPSRPSPVLATKRPSTIPKTKSSCSN
jgi:hypothetical protein